MNSSMSASTQQVSEWLSSFGTALDRADYDAAVQMFEEEKHQSDAGSDGTRSEAWAMANRRQCNLGKRRYQQLVHF